MTFDEYQQLAMRTADTTLETGDALIVSALGLSGEAGEFTDTVKKVIFHHHPLNPIPLSKEIGDILWYCAHAANALGMSLDDIAQANIDKLAARYPEGFDPARSLNRQ